MSKYVYAFIQVAILVSIALVFVFNHSLTRPVSHHLHILSGGFDGIALNINRKNMTNPRLLGSFEVTNGTTKDIEVYIFQKLNFINWKNGYNSTPMFESGRVTTSRFELNLARTDIYYIIFDNKYSESPKDIDVNSSLMYSPAFLGLPLWSWASIIGIPAFAGVVFYQYIKEGKRKTPLETSIMAFSLTLIVIVGMTFYFPFELSNWISTVLTALNVILVLFNVRLAQGYMKIQILHVDRKKSLDKLWSILEKSKGYTDLMKQIKSFMKTLDFELLPDNVKEKTRNRISDLAILEGKAPWKPKYSEEEAEKLMEEAEEMRQEQLKSMNEAETFQVMLDAEELQVKSDIKKRSKTLF